MKKGKSQFRNTNSKELAKFLRVNENKAKLFKLISDYVTCIECDKIIVATKNEKVVTDYTSTDLR